MAQEPKTDEDLSLALKPKRKAGRPKNRRNTICVREDIERAMNTGMSITQLKEHIEYFIENPVKGMTVKSLLDYIKTDIQVWQFLIESDKYYAKLDEQMKSKSKEKEEELVKPEGTVYPFSLTAE